MDLCHGYSRLKSQRGTWPRKIAGILLCIDQERDMPMLMLCPSDHVISVEGWTMVKATPLRPT